MIFDIHTATGHWPFRQVPNETLPQLKRLLEQHCIAGAAVVHTHGLFYKNCNEANHELAEAIADYPDFFAGIATLNPQYAAWEKDLCQCVKNLRMKALRMAPQYHDYDLDAPQARAMLAATAELRLPVFIPARVVDVRQRHWLDTERQLTVEEIGRFSLSVPGARVVVTEAAVSAPELIDANGQPRYPGLYFVMSRLQSAYGQTIAELAKAIGADHLLFGSGTPFKDILPSLLKLHAIDCPDEVRSQIAGANAQSLLDNHSHHPKCTAGGI